MSATPEGFPLGPSFAMNELIDGAAFALDVPVICARSSGPRISRDAAPKSNARPQNALIGWSDHHAVGPFGGLAADQWGDPFTPFVVEDLMRELCATMRTNCL